MPLIEIHLDAELYQAKSDQIGQAIHEAQIEVLDIPPVDRFQLFQPRRPGELRFDPTYGGVDRQSLVLIKIIMVARYPVKLKRALFEAIATRLEPVGIRHQDLLICLSENHYEDWYAGS